jgi:RNA polymerase sigma-70 factor (ECF subfamily)
METDVADTTVSLQFGNPTAQGASAASTEDHVLVAGLCAGQADAYETLLERFEQPVYSIVNRLLEDPSDSADVVQEVFLKVFRNVNSFRGDSSLKTWIYRIAVNEARNQRRWFGRHRAKETGMDLEAGVPREWLADPGRSPYQVTLDHEAEHLLEAGLKRVNPHFRAALVLREIEGLSYEEIAAVEEISLGTVKSRILRGREALRRELIELLAPSAALDWSLPLAPQEGDVV